MSAFPWHCSVPELVITLPHFQGDLVILLLHAAAAAAETKAGLGKSGTKERKLVGLRAQIMLLEQVGKPL